MTRLRDTSGEAMAAAFEAQRRAALPPAPALTALQARALRGDLHSLNERLWTARGWHAVRKGPLLAPVEHAAHAVARVAAAWDALAGDDPPAVSPELAGISRSALAQARLAAAEVVALRSISAGAQQHAMETVALAIDIAQRLAPSPTASWPVDTEIMHPADAAAAMAARIGGKGTAQR